MKINYLLLLCCFFTSFSLSAQLDPWSRTYPSDGRNLQPIGVLSETDDFVQSLNRGIYATLSHYGELDDELVVLGGGVGTSFQASFLLESKEEAGNQLYLQGNRDIRNIFFTVFDDQGILNELEMPDSLGVVLTRKGPGLASLANNEYWIFGNKNFHKVRWSGTSDLEIIETKPGNFGLIAAATPISNGYILCNESGHLIAVDQDAEVLWSKQYNDMEFTDIESLSDGYILCGQIEDSLALIRTDLDGEILWQKKYEGRTAFDLIVTDNGDFVATGDNHERDIQLLRTDANGNQKWLNKYEGKDGRGINVIESRYGGFYVQAQIEDETRLIRVDEEGKTGANYVLGEAVLSINDIATSTSSTGVMFYDEGNAFYRFPKDSDVSTIFSSALWISARDASDDLYLSAQTYGSQNAPQDYQPGYIGSNPDQFDKVWSVSKRQIELFRADQMQSVSTIPWSQDILTWPAKGNPNVVVNGETVDIPVDLAPFVDLNGDGIYNAFDGDYPKITGDQMLFWVMNDATPVNSGGTPLEIDILCSMYAFSDEGVENNVPATFVDFVLVNRSDRDYKDVSLGLFTDFDLGCFTDDYIGSMPEAHGVYVYNESSLDDQSCANGVPSIGGFWPIQVASYMNHDLNNAMYYNSGALNPPPGTDDPQTAIEFDRLLHSIWRDGTPLTTGGTGYNLTGGTPTSFMFPASPSDLGGWSMCASFLGNADRRTVMNASVNALAQGEQIRHSVAYLTLGEFITPCPDVAEVKQDAIDIRNYFNAAWPDFTLDLGPDRLLDQGANLTLDAGPAYTSYEWSDGSADQTLLVTQAGVYSVLATTPLGFQRRDTIRVDFVTSTNEPDLTAPMIFPNPSSGLLYISPGTVALESIEVRNVLGQRLKTFSTSASSSFQLNLSDLNTGTYLLLIKGSDGQEWLRKILLAR